MPINMPCSACDEHKKLCMLPDEMIDDDIRQAMGEHQENLLIGFLAQIARNGKHGNTEVITTLTPATGQIIKPKKQSGSDKKK